MPRTRYHHGDLRQALLDAALELILERGPDGFTLRETARRVGVSHSAPYRHFSDKDALLTSVAETGFEELARRGEAAMKGEGLEGDERARARLRAFGAAYLQFAAQNPAQYRVMFGRSIRDPSPALERASSLAFELLAQTVADVLGLPSANDARDSAMAIMAGVHGLATLALDGMIDDEPGRYEQLSAVTLTLLDAGLK